MVGGPWNSRRRRFAGLAFGLIAMVAAGAAAAQGFVRPGDLGAYEIVQRLHAQGFTIAGSIMRNRDVYLVDVVGGQGRMLRLIVDPRNGRVLERFAERQVDWRATPDADLAMPGGRFAPPLPPPVMMEPYGGEVLMVPGNQPGWRPPPGSAMAREEQGGPVIVGPNGPRGGYEMTPPKHKPKPKSKPAMAKPGPETPPATTASPTPAATPPQATPEAVAPAPTPAPEAKAPEPPPAASGAPAAEAQPQAPGTNAPATESTAKPEEAKAPEPEAKAPEPEAKAPDTAPAPAAETAPAKSDATPTAADSAPAAPAESAKAAAPAETPAPAPDAAPAEQAKSAPEQPAPTLEKPASAAAPAAPAAATASVKPVDKSMAKGGAANKPINDLPVSPLE